MSIILRRTVVTSCRRHMETYTTLREKDHVVCLTTPKSTNLKWLMKRSLSYGLLVSTLDFLTLIRPRTVGRTMLTIMLASKQRESRVNITRKYLNPCVLPNGYVPPLSLLLYLLSLRLVIGMTKERQAHFQERYNSSMSHN